MPSSATETSIPPALRVTITDDVLAVDLEDGRTISAPLAWYPRLLHGTNEERNHWRFTGSGRGIHWPDLDEDVSVENLLSGKPSGESRRSFELWLAGRSGNGADPENEA